ncbi:MAG: PilZ domain-containing protein [Nitrospinota bacterium]|nr:PilZ domain-containing protein [Nitrospinota bacterium]
MDNSQDKRHFPRADICLKIEVDTGSGRIYGEIQNITVEGIAFTLDRELAVGSRVGVEISSRDKEIHATSLQAEILRCEPGTGGAAPLYKISAKLINANDEFLMDALAMVHGPRTGNS